MINGDEKNRERINELELQTANLLKGGKRDDALDKIDEAMGLAQAMSDFDSNAALLRKYDDIEAGGNPYKESNKQVGYFLTFVCFILGSLILFGNITGNVVGQSNIRTGLIGVVLFIIGIVGTLFLVWKTK